jgi:GxxExxY protein
VAGDVHETDFAKMSEPQIDRNATPFFFFKTVRVDARECPDQRGLAMIDVSRGAYDERNGSCLLLKAYRPRMDANEREFMDALVEEVIGAAYEVANTLGAGFLESVYRRALMRELRMRGRDVRTEIGYSVTYKGASVGDFHADLVIERRLVVELKCVEQISKEHLAQCINYLKAADLRIALLINFKRSKIEWKRIVNNY